ncbi:uncharacterized protein LOC116293615 [Actinia tenebrosa]|uniref:Uncharacterized protein LOC116293615 n=1 Tax=Actinia tenebrosa TaxID=6105 RepID=A0A6P8HPE3_ACTTE|nr:uncharacterized protein LOC116293615 [Actinia tenebrosa]
MSTSASGWMEPVLLAFEVENNVKNRRIFRTVSREICGESMEPSEGGIVLFGTIQHNSLKDGVVSVASGKNANSNVFDPNDRSFYHWLDFLFVNKDFQQNGYGSIMVQHLEQKLRAKLKRPIRLKSAEKAKGFFQKLGYEPIGEPIRNVDPGCHLFRCLQLMEKFNNEFIRKV